MHLKGQLGIKSLKNFVFDNQDVIMKAYFCITGAEIVQKQYFGIHFKVQMVSFSSFR